MAAAAPDPSLPDPSLPAGLPPLVGKVTVYRRSRCGWLGVGVAALFPVLLLCFIRDLSTLLCELPLILVLVVLCVVLPFAGDWVMVVADDEGIAARDWSWLKLKWADIDDVRVYRHWLSGRVLALDLRNPDAYVARMSRAGRWSCRLNQRMLGAAFVFNPTGLTASPDQIVAKIRRHQRFLA